LASQGRRPSKPALASDVVPGYGKRVWDDLSDLDELHRHCDRKYGR
jgi:hypothetical protein